MALFRILAATLLSAAASTAENAVAGKWSCTNVPVSGPESPWTLHVREDGPKLDGSLTDGQANIPISEAQLKGMVFTFRFYINEKPYSFEGKVEGKKLDGKYSGEEASGRLRCAKAAN
jgi:hypothetical protein